MAAETVYTLSEEAAGNRHPRPSSTAQRCVLPVSFPVDLLLCMAEINPPESKLAKLPFVHCAPRRRTPRRWPPLDRWIYGTQAAAMYYSRATACHSGFKRLQNQPKISSPNMISRVFPFKFLQIHITSVSGLCVH